MIYIGVALVSCIFGLCPDFNFTLDHAFVFIHFKGFLSNGFFLYKLLGLLLHLIFKDENSLIEVALLELYCFLIFIIGLLYRHIF